MAKKKDYIIQKIDPMPEATESDAKKTAQPESGTTDVESPTQQPEENSIATAFKNPRTGVKIALGAVGGVVLGVAIVGGMMTMHTTYQTADKVASITVEQQAQDENTAKLEEKVEAHVHTWVPNYVNIHHDAVFENVWHEPIYSQETTYHSVCNDCKKIVDGIAADHIADTGHSGYATNVPIVNEVLVQAGYSEPVQIQEAWDEVQIDGATCTSCGKQLTAEQVASDESIAISVQNAGAVS